MHLATELPGIIGITSTDLNCYVSHNQYSRDYTNYRFLFEAEYNICMLCVCVFTGIDYFLCAVFDTIILKI